MGGISRVHRSQASDLLRNQLIPISTEPELQLWTEHGTLTDQVSIVRPPIVRAVEEQTNTPKIPSTSELFIDTTQSILPGTSQENNEQGSGGPIQRDLSSTEHKNPRKRTILETEEDKSSKKIKLSNNSKKRYDSETKTSDNNKEDSESLKTARQQRKRRGRTRTVGRNVYIGVFAAICCFLI